MTVDLKLSAHGVQMIHQPLGIAVNLDNILTQILIVDSPKRGSVGFENDKIVLFGKLHRQWREGDYNVFLPPFPALPLSVFLPFLVIQNVRFLECLIYIDGISE